MSADCFAFFEAAGIFSVSQVAFFRLQKHVLFQSTVLGWLDLCWRVADFSSCSTHCVKPIACWRFCSSKELACLTAF